MRPLWGKQPTVFILGGHIIGAQQFRQSPDVAVENALVQGVVVVWSGRNRKRALMVAGCNDRASATVRLVVRVGHHWRKVRSQVN